MESQEAKLFRVFCTVATALDQLDYRDKALVLRIVSDRIDYENQMRMKAEYASQSGCVERGPLRPV